MAQSDYQDMIEIPVSTCEMVVLPKKKKRKNVKKKVIDKVNKKAQTIGDEAKVKEKKVKTEKIPDFEEKPYGETEYFDSNYSKTSGAVVEPTKVKIKGKKFLNFDIVSIQVVAVFVLIVGILLTNIFWENSGINRLIATVFNRETVVEKDYSDFKLSAPKNGEVTLGEGVISISGEGSIYSPCEGVVSKVEKNGEKYTVTINHSDKFYSEFKNLDLCYFEEGESVFLQVPVAYCYDGCEMRMYSDSVLLTNYVIADGSIVWES